MKKFILFCFALCSVFFLISCINLTSSAIRVILPDELYAGKPFELKIGVVNWLGVPLKDVDVNVNGLIFTTDESGYARVPLFLNAGPYTLEVSYGKVTEKIFLNVEEASWLVLCWFGADNDLSNYVAGDLAEMQMAAGDVSVIVLVDQSSNLNDGVYALSIDGRFVKVESFANDIDSGSKDNFSRFVEKYHAYAAKRKALVLWNHGTAWDDTERYKIKGISYDDESRDFLKISELKEALENFHWDVLGFDACLMGSVEVLYELRGLADLFIAAPSLIPGSGWNYKFLSEVSDVEPEDFCKKTIEYWRQAYGDPNYENVLNGWRSNQLSKAVNTLAIMVKGTPAIQTHATVYNDNPRLCDLGEVLEEFGWNQALSEFQSARIPEATDSKIYLSVFLPADKNELESYYSMYSLLSFAKDAAWLDWLDSLW
ncbi:hypothetical protein AS159_07805 [Thermotoga sp. Ku-13t]|uniref:clostripain-related cysteine peptidase n=1 Tax=Thermotoga sp. Ku-13t TaxID=1755813 RepID=UPI0013EC10A7|nr:clostripain-related cysteine peptidase [Thermotoga sp. Ku-13t]KAF2957558.1 hypothetical protein AS159_07805 [Thermotoga sp. Ku-13t]